MEEKHIKREMEEKDIKRKMSPFPKAILFDSFSLCCNSCLPWQTMTLRKMHIRRCSTRKWIMEFSILTCRGVHLLSNELTCVLPVAFRQPFIGVWPLCHSGSSYRKQNTLQLVSVWHQMTYPFIESWWNSLNFWKATPWNWSHQQILFTT